MKLTKSYIDSAVFEGTGDKHDMRWDESLVGFGLRIHPSGRKTFVLRYRSAGRQHLMKLGAYGVLTLQAAKDLARVKLAQVIGGCDPLEARKREAAGDTVAAMCDLYMKRHAEGRKKTTRDDRRRIDKAILPAWRNVKARAVTRSEVIALHSRIGESAPYEANRTLALISKMWNLAEQWGCVPEGHPNPSRGIQKYREIKRARFVTHEEMPSLAQAVEREINPYVKGAVWLYLLLGLRKTELLSLRWEQIDIRRQELVLNDTKANRPHYLPIPGPAMAILASLPRVTNNPFIFVGNRDGKRLVEINKAWGRIRKCANLPDVRLHDLRRTVGSWMAQSGASLPLIGCVLNHSNSSTTQIYARFSQEPVRQALEQHASHLLQQAGR